MMRTLVSIAALMFIGTAHAGDWDGKDSLLLATALSALAIDWGNPGRFTEGNPILGPPPSGVTAVEVFVIISNHGAGIRADF